jgi:hypothetical protein
MEGAEMSRREELVNKLADTIHDEIVRQRKYVIDGETGEGICMKIDLWLLAESVLDVAAENIRGQLACSTREVTQ